MGVCVVVWVVLTEGGGCEGGCGLVFIAFSTVVLKNKIIKKIHSAAAQLPFLAPHLPSIPPSPLSSRNTKIAQHLELVAKFQYSFELFWTTKNTHHLFAFLGIFVA